MTRKSKLPAGVLIAATLVSLSARPPQAAQAPAPRRGMGLISRAVPDPAAVERGQKDFVAKCGFCHGSNANGGENRPDPIRSVGALDDEKCEHIPPGVLPGPPDKSKPRLPLPCAP